MDYTLHMSSIDRLYEEAAQLPEDQRMTLARRLLSIGEPLATKEVEQEWDQVIQERIREYDEGRSPSQKAGEVFSELDRKLSQ